ncbi:hypothetical protein EDB87DRAFT_1684215 [Lactarius vividus]|nr:hypothetical protein EDB87DRAFT_1684215 [Lactarius vividus]
MRWCLDNVAAHAPAALLGRDVMDERALETQGVAMLVVRRKMSIDEPTASPTHTGPALVAPGSTLGGSAGGDGGLSSA